MHSPFDGRPIAVVNGLNVLIKSHTIPLLEEIHNLDDVKSDIEFAKKYGNDLIIIIPFNEKLSKTIHKEGNYSDDILTAMILNEHGKYQNTIHI